MNYPSFIFSQTIYLLDIISRRLSEDDAVVSLTLKLWLEAAFARPPSHTVLDIYHKLLISHKLFLETSKSG